MENSAITRRLGGVNQGSNTVPPIRYLPGLPPHKNCLRLSSSASSTIYTPYHNLSDLRTRNNYLSMQLESHSYSDCCLPASDAIRRGDQLHSPHPRCARCPQLETPMDQCEEEACPILDITSQCTEKCVVVACDDPTHPGPSCHVAGGDTVCDSTCSLDEDCVDCTGLEEFVCHNLLSPYSF